VTADRASGAGSEAPINLVTETARNRGRPPALAPGAVTEVALAIVDRDGLGGLTMRRVADELGVGLATLYKAAGSKDAILLDMVDVVLGGLPEADHTPGREYEAILELWTATHELMCEHPAVAQLGALQPVGGARMFALVEATLELLRSGGVDEDRLPVAYQTVRSYALGFTLLRISRGGSIADQEEERQAAMRGLPAERFPEVASHAGQLTGPMTTPLFVDGLGHLLRGFLPQRSA
jgi:AcrR family transcriptional regulator